MDLTAGYHQAAMSLAARVYTAFITYTGIYQFIRLPFGLKRAPSYFQEMMASVVLIGLKNLRSFLGLANYFRDFVPNHSNVVNPSHKMIDYSASKQAKLTLQKQAKRPLQT
jgi:hypothetical protein